jgi:hypothetical protein
MAPGLDGVTDIAVVAELVVCGRVPRGRFAPSLLSRHSAPERGWPELLLEETPPLSPIGRV